MPLALPRKSISLGWWLSLALWFGFVPFTEGLAKATLIHAQGFEVSFCQVENGNRAKTALHSDESRLFRSSSDSAVVMEETSGPEGRKLKPHLVSIDLALVVPQPLYDVTRLAASAFPKVRRALLRNLLLGLPPPHLA